MSTMTAFVCTLNEEKNIGSWLENMKKADAIVVFFGGSEDHTIQIVREFEHPNLRLILTKERNVKYRWDEAQVRNQCLSMFDTDWILLMDADELISDQFWEYKDEILSTNKLAYYIPHYNLWMNNKNYRVDGFWYPDLTLRLFKNNVGFRWVGAVHGSLWMNNRVCYVTDFDMGIIPKEVHFFHYHRVNPAFLERDKNHPTSLQDIGGTPILKELLVSHPVARG